MTLSLLALVIVFSGTIYYYWTTQTEDPENVVETSTIGTGDIILSATGLGTLIPKEEVSFGFENGGEVSEVLVGLGEEVEAGQVLARLESKTLELKYKQAEGNLAALSSASGIAEAAQAVQEAKENFAAARNDLEYLIGTDMLLMEERVTAAGQDLQLAQAAVTKDASVVNKQNLSDAEARFAKAQEAFTNAYYAYSSNYTLQTFTYPVRNDKGTTISQTLFAPTNSEIESARAAYELAAANLSDAQNYLDVLNRVQTTDAVPMSSVASLTTAQLALESAETALDATELIAPISGTITSIAINKGEDVGTSAVVTISDINQPYLIDVSLDETDWDKAKVGYAATVTFDLLPDENYPAKIIQVYPKLDDSSGTSMVHILVQVDDSIGVDLPAGSTASVDVVGGDALNAVLVPISALDEINPGKYVVYIMNNGEPVQQEVEIGLQDILYAEVKSGLQQGDVILTDATTVTP